TTWKSHVDLETVEPASIDAFDFHGNLGNTQPCRESAQPCLIGSRGNEGAEHHVTADPSEWVEDGKTAFRHRLKDHPIAGPRQISPPVEPASPGIEEHHALVLPNRPNVAERHRCCHCGTSLRGKVYPFPARDQPGPFGEILVGDGDRTATGGPD